MTANPTNIASGYFLVYRSMMEDPLWLSEPFTRSMAKMDLIFLARYEDHSSYIYIRGNKIEIKRGDIGWSKEKLSARWKWDRKKTTKFLNELEYEGFLTQKRDNRRDNRKSALLSVISINNYDEYQQKRTTEGTTEGTTEHPHNNKRKERELNKTKKDTNVSKKESGFKKPTLQEVAEYCKERGNDVNPEKFIAYYESNGWKVGRNSMKSWKAAIVSTWEKKVDCDICRDKGYVMLKDNNGKEIRNNCTHKYKNRKTEWLQLMKDNQMELIK